MSCTSDSRESKIPEKIEVIVDDVIIDDVIVDDFKVNCDFTDAATSINDSSVDMNYYDPEVGHVSSLDEFQTHTKNDGVMVGWTKVGKDQVLGSPIADKVPQRPYLGRAGGGDTVSRRV